MDMIIIIIAFIFLALILLLLNWMFEHKGRGNSKHNKKKRNTVKKCPLCGSGLLANETVKTIVFSGTKHGNLKVEESMAHIMGCPFCYPHNTLAPRRCPSCKKELSNDGYVVARYFTQRGKKHIHVLGCTECRMVR